MARGHERRAVHSWPVLAARRGPGRRPEREAAARGSSSGCALALAAHDPERTLARGYALVEDRAGTPARLRGGRARRRRAGRSASTTVGPAVAGVDEEVERDRAHATSRRSARIEEIIRRLDSGDAGLRETLDLVAEGRELVEYCAAELDAVSQGLEELRLEELVTRLEGAQARQ